MAFQATLNKVCRDLQHYTNSEEIQRKLLELIHEISSYTISGALLKRGGTSLSMVGQVP